MTTNVSAEGQLFPEPLQPGVVLTDGQIQELVDRVSLIDKGTFDHDGLDACSYDIRIGNKGILGGSLNEVDLANEPIELAPGAYAAVISLERLNIPDNIIVRINTKRSISYDGIVLLTSSQVDPGYKGHLLFGFYNASPKKRALRRTRAICSLVFEALAAPVPHPKEPDPDLSKGRFPGHFVDNMAEMDVFSWQQLTEHVKKIDKITTELMELRTKYDDVMQPIKELSVDVERLTVNVDKLQGNIGDVGHQVSRLENLASDNNKQITDITRNVTSLVTEARVAKSETERLSTDHEGHSKEIRNIRISFGRFSMVVYVFWAILLLFFGALIGSFIIPKLSEDNTESKVPAVKVDTSASPQQGSAP